MSLDIRCFYFPRSIELLASNISKVKLVRIFTIPRLDSAQQYNSLVDKIREKFNLTENERLITTYLFENQLITFDSWEDMQFFYRNRDSSQTMLYNVYVGLQTEEENKQGNFLKLMSFSWWASMYLYGIRFY
jgi:hypothetical protein